MLGLGLSRIVPPILHPQLWRAATWIRFGPDLAESLRFARARQGLARPAFKGDRVAVVGLFGSRIGIGRAADLLARELEASGSAVLRIDITQQLGMEVELSGSGETGLDALADPTLTDIILHINPPEFYRVLALVGKERLQGRCLVAYFAWELDQVPGWWRSAIACADEIWVPSAFVRDALEATVPTCAARLRVAPHRVDPVLWQPASPEERRAARAALGLSASAFVVLTSFAMTSTIARKNPVDAIRGFRQAFPDPAGDEALLVRCLYHHHYHPGVMAMLRAAEGDGRVRLLLEEAVLSSILDCYRAADVYLTLHRGEGYGLNIDEALKMRIPVVATAWSLNDGFLADPLLNAVGSRLVPVVDAQHVYDRVPGARWPEPDIGEAAAALRCLRAAAAT